jgi:tetratricopeptide (TPR) repeat protein
MSLRRSIVFVVLSASAVIAIVALGGPIGRWFQTPRSLRKARELVDQRMFKEAQAALEHILARKPDDREANMLMAQLQVEKEGPDPAAALAALKKIRTRDPIHLAAIRVIEGKAYYLSRRYAKAESAWLEALRLDPQVAEAGWLLLQQYYLQGRENESRSLALRLCAIEPDPQDRVRYLLELAREDVEHLAAAGVIQWLEPVVKLDPRDRMSALALGRARVKEGKIADGLSMLRQAVDESGSDRDGWDALLSGLEDAGQIDALEKELGRLPAGLASDLRFAVHAGRVASERRDYAAAVEHYKRALGSRTGDARTLHRLARTLRLAHRDDEAKHYEQLEASVNAAAKELKELLKKADSINTLGRAPETVLFQQIADVRERQGKGDEALAWHKLVLRDEPDNLLSLGAVARLSAEQGQADPRRSN